MQSFSCMHIFFYMHIFSFMQVFFCIHHVDMGKGVRHLVIIIPIGYDREKGLAVSYTHLFRVCSAFSEEPTAGEATFALAPRSFKDVDGNMAVPDKGFKLTLEMLRRKPDSALVWYEDFQRCV